uniref:DnaJ homolog subfamily C member 30, mitochondrial n=1 Tax=Oryzias latipes TaxID=8090 RepID=H2MJZ9_ORYLA
MLTFLFFSVQTKCRDIMAIKQMTAKSSGIFHIISVKRHFVRSQCLISNLWSTLPSLRHKGRRENGSAFIREFSSNGARTEPLYKTKTGYYEVLQVTSVASQAQIKTAYYKQSFIYHPDRNAGSDDATARFSEISEAYTVLGNKALRRKYDRGLLSPADLTAAVRPSAKDTSGGTFDFDQFYKSHYSEQLQRQRDIRVRKEEIMNRKRETMEDRKLGRLFEVTIAVLLIFAFGLIRNIQRG